MDVTLLVARLALACIFFVSGTGKLLDPTGSRKAVADFGVPARFSTIVSILLPIAELAVAVALIPASTAKWGAIAGLMLLLVFTGAISFALAHGRAPDCHCFGQIHSAPASRGTLVRNVLLSGIALLIAIGSWNNGGIDPMAALAALSGMERSALLVGLLLLTAFGGLGWLLINLMQQNGRLLLRIEALEHAVKTGDVLSPSEPVTGKRRPEPLLAPEFNLQDLKGQNVTLAALGMANKPILLIFTDPGCSPCNQLLPDIARWQRQYGNLVTIAIASRGTAEASRAKADEHGLHNVLLQPGGKVAHAYGVNGTPAAVLVEPGGVISQPVSNGADAVRALAAFLFGETGTNLPLAPDFSLASIHDGNISLANLRDAGKLVLLIFIDSRCTPCDALLPQVARWQQETERFTVAVVSNGDVRMNREKAERHGVAIWLIQKDLEVVKAFGLTQAPAAVLVDPDGTIREPAAYGETNIQRLVSGITGPHRADAGMVGTGSGSVLGPPIQIGDEVPDIELLTVNDDSIRLRSLKGADTVLLFWSPDCIYCQHLNHDLKRLEETRLPESPRIVVISTGSAEATRRQGITSLTALDPGRLVGSRFGTSVTPSAVLLDASARLAGPVSSGSGAVKELLEATVGSQTREKTWAK